MGTNGRTIASMCLAVLVSVLLLIPVTSQGDDNSSYSNWPAVADWVALSNNLWQCYSGIVDRCRALPTGVVYPPDPPTCIYPMVDYTRFAAKLDEMIPYFVCQTNADASGTFTTWFATNNYSFPMWTRSNLLMHCRVTNAVGRLTNSCENIGWFTNMILHSWELVDRSIQVQITTALQTLVWTRQGQVGAPGSVRWIVPENGKMNFFVGEGRAATWGGTYASALADFHGEDESGFPPARYALGWYLGPGSYAATGVGIKSKLNVSGLNTNIPHETAFYVYAQAPDFGNGVWDSYGEPLVNKHYSLVDTVPSNSLGSVTSTVAIGSTDFPANWCDAPTAAETQQSKGFNCDATQSYYFPSALLKWGFPAISTNYILQPAVPDLDRDDIVDIGVDIDSFGPDSGTIVFRADQDFPYVVLPIASPPAWYAGLFAHAYLSQGGSGTNLPFHYLTTNAVTNLVDNDGFFTAYSLNTRVLESGSGCVTNISVTNKQVSIVRPRGAVVAFEFDGTNDGVNAGFRPVGWPIGINSNRNYVLRDPTPGIHTDLVYNLFFASGIVHQFGPDGMMTNICHVDGRSATSVPGSELSFPDSAFDTRYNTSLTWDHGVVSKIEYASKGSPTILTTVSSNSLRSINKLSKSCSAMTSISDSNAEVTGATETNITYKWGEVARGQSGPAGSNRTVKLVTTVKKESCGSSGQKLTEITGLNLADRVTNFVASANGFSATNRYEFYSVDGRYTNGFLRSAKLKKITWDDGSANSYKYEDYAGWITNDTMEVGNGASRITALFYKDAHGGDSARTNYPVERPREIRRLWRDGSTEVVIGKTLAAYSGATWTRIQECTDAGAGWDDSGNLFTTNNYLTTDDLSYSLLDSSCYPAGSSAFSYDVSTVSEAEIGKLTSAIEYSSGVTVTNRVNAFGHSELSGIAESGVCTYGETCDNDDFGRALSATYALDSTSEQFEDYTLHGPTTIIERDGSATTVVYYKTGSINTIDRTSLGRKTDYEYDALANVTKVTETGGSDSTTGSYISDVRGRVRSRSDQLGTTTYDYAKQSYGTRRTTTAPGANGSTTVMSDFYNDGAIKEISGSGAATTASYDYAKDGSKFRSKREASASEWIKNYYNMLGSPDETERNGTGAKASRYYEQGTGRFIREIDEESISRVTAYSAVDGRVSKSGQDTDNDGVLTAAGTDRFDEYTRAVSTDGIRNETCTYTTNGLAVSTVLSTTLVSLDGRRQVNTHVSTTNTSVQSGFTGAGAYTVSSTNADNSYAIREYKKWLLDNVMEYDSSGVWQTTESYGYDGLGALTSITSTSTGVTRTTSIQLDSARRVWKVTTGKGTVEYTYYPDTTLRKTVKREDGSIVRYDYYDNGLLKREYDSKYDVETEYDSQGRKIKQTSWTGAGTSTGNVTEWVFDPYTGWLHQKKINGRVVESYTYLKNGELATVTDANSVCKTLTRNSAGDVVLVSWSDGKTPSISFLDIDRRGRPHTIVCGNITNTVDYALDGSIISMGFTGDSIPASDFRYERRSFDGVLQSVTYTINGESVPLSVERDDWSRIMGLTNGNVAVAYSYGPGSRLVATNVVFVNGSACMTRATSWDMTNSRISSISWTHGAGSNSFAYSYKTNSDRIDRMTLEDGTYWEYAYDCYDQLVSGRRHLADGSDYPGMAFAYGFDAVGNTTNAGFVLPNGRPAHVFQADQFNLHVTRIWSNKVELIGTSTAATNVTITVNDQPCVRDGEKFRCLLPIENAAGSLETNIVVYAVSNAVGGDLVAAVSGRLFVAKSVEPVTNTPAGTIEADSRYAYEWDALNRLVTATTTNACPTQKVEFAYYPGQPGASSPVGPRATKKVFEWRDGDWSNTWTHGFVYDGWNLVHEKITCYTGTTAQVATRDYFWGLDLVGQRDGRIGQDAGGIGGLISITEKTAGSTNVYLPICDHNGNIHAVIDTSGQVVARYIYSPFGVLIGEYGTKVDVCPFRFQSKFFDSETGLYYYGYRYYDPASTKWLCNDPLGEQAGVNLSAFCGNDPVNRWDKLGLLEGKELKVYNDALEQYRASALFNTPIGQRVEEQAARLRDENKVAFVDMGTAIGNIDATHGDYGPVSSNDRMSLHKGYLEPRYAGYAVFTIIHEAVHALQGKEQPSRQWESFEHEYEAWVFEKVLRAELRPNGLFYSFFKIRVGTVEIPYREICKVHEVNWSEARAFDKWKQIWPEGFDDVVVLAQKEWTSGRQVARRLAWRKKRAERDIEYSKMSGGTWGATTPSEEALRNDTWAESLFFPNE